MRDFTLRLNQDWVKVESVEETDDEPSGWTVKSRSNPSGIRIARVPSISDPHTMWSCLNLDQKDRVKASGWLSVCADEDSIVYIALREMRPTVAPEVTAHDVLLNLKSQQQLTLRELSAIDLSFYAGRNPKDVLSKLESLFTEFNMCKEIANAILRAESTKRTIEKLRTWQFPLARVNGGS